MSVLSTVYKVSVYQEVENPRAHSNWSWTYPCLSLKYCVYIYVCMCIYIYTGCFRKMGPLSKQYIL